MIVIKTIDEKYEKLSSYSQRIIGRGNNKYSGYDLYSPFLIEHVCC